MNRDMSRTGSVASQPAIVGVALGFMWLCGERVRRRSAAPRRGRDESGPQNAELRGRGASGVRRSPKTLRPSSTRTASCHRPGEIGPMPLLSYEDARP